MEQNKTKLSVVTFYGQNDQLKGQNGSFFLKGQEEIQSEPDI